MRFFTILFVCILIFTVATEAIFLAESFYSQGNILEKQEMFHLFSITNSKSSLVNDYIVERKEEAVYLSSLPEIKNIFSDDLIFNTDLIKEDTNKVSSRVIKEIEQYLLENREKTLKDLQSDLEFRKIAIQQVGKNGYTFLYDPDSQLNVLHKEETRVGFDYASLPDSQADLRDYIGLAKYQQEVSGFYDRLESDGQIREKYMHIIVSRINTKDNKRLAIGSTVYLDEYGKSAKLAKEIDQTLRYFQTSHNYEDLILIDKNGVLIWAAKNRQDLGINLESNSVKNVGLFNIYSQARDDLKVKFIGPIYNPLRENLIILIVSPVLDNNGNFLGVLGLEISNKEILNLTNFESSFAKIHLINSNEDLISSSEDDSKLNLDTIGEIKKDCFSNELKDKEINSIKFSYKSIKDTNWCLISEENKISFKEGNLNTFYKIQIEIISFALLALLLGFILSVYLKNNYTIKKIKRGNVK